ncbi:5-formyltetrahydrofolate cyclo-ligase [Hoyosella sp. G463]|uniref:5-formyltetrahydrofolate cyclo-ligase n=1 Tax=Lolliginicoccus lacisalsi TaxID=2742202 RepID=A0A927JCH7_9ACTN|nr:5-formyltetrahydrofolate cyclo-ligase [Lolliginicoccus lacisalsi]MBD8506102.1 5-formyltetrahydrofolate cyclo-ligase [Lolliginicoccus lacisalsi]
MLGDSTNTDHPGSGPDPGNQHGKSAWRTFFVNARATLPRAVHAAEAEQIAVHAVAVAQSLAPDRDVAAYAPSGTEPGSALMLEALVAAGFPVILPIMRPGSALDWARFEGAAAFRQARFGILEPAGPLLGPGGVQSCGLVLVPALAVDRTGTRLGRGAGFYDRALGALAHRPPLIAVVRDEELVDHLPADPHDVRMDGVITPSGGHIRLPAGVEGTEGA